MAKSLTKKEIATYEALCTLINDGKRISKLFVKGVDFETINMNVIEELRHAYHDSEDHVQPISVENESGTEIVGFIMGSMHELEKLFENYRNAVALYLSDDLAQAFYNLEAFRDELKETYGFEPSN